jgi:hypothetical protein
VYQNSVAGGQAGFLFAKIPKYRCEMSDNHYVVRAGLALLAGVSVSLALFVAVN